MKAQIRQSIKSASFWFATYPVPGGRSFICVTDDFGNLVEIDRAAVRLSLSN